MPKVNSEAADYESAIKSLEKYETRLIELRNTMWIAVEQAKQNFEGDSNIEAVSDRLSDSVRKIGEATDQVKKIRLELSRQLQRANEITEII